MPLGIAAQIGIQFGLGVVLSYLGRRREKDPVKHSDLRAIELKTGVDKYPAQYAIGETRVSGVEIFRGVEEVQHPEGVSLPAGVGRRLHMAFALSRGSLDSLIGVIVNGKLIEYDGTSEDNTSDGGLVYGGENVYGGSTFQSPKVICYFKGDGTQGESLREARPLMAGGAPLEWGEDQRGDDVSWVHCTFYQPPYGDNEKTGVELKKVWDGIPEIEFIVKGMALPKPARGAPQSSWNKEYTDSAAAARYWFMRERMGVGEQAFIGDNVWASHLRCTKKVQLNPPASWTNLPEDGTALVRCVYRANSTRTGRRRPPLPAGNDYPPTTGGWVTVRPKPTAERNAVWAIWQVRQFDNTWSNWMYIKDATPIEIYKGGFASVAQGSMGPGLDMGPDIYIPPIVNPIPNAGDILDPGDIDPNVNPPTNIYIPPGVIPGNMDPCDPEDGLTNIARADSEFSRYGVGFVLYSDDKPESVYRELDFAWAGIVARDGGQVRFLPGMDYNHVATFNKDNAQMLSVSPSPQISERTNSVTCGMAESKHHRWGEFQLVPIKDQFLIDRWGIELAKDLKVAAYVQPSFTALTLLCYKWLRAAGYDRRYTIQSVIGNEAEYLNVKIGDRVLVDFPQYGLKNGTRPNATVGLPECRVEAKRINTRTGQLEFDVVYHPSGAIYRDDLAFADNRIDASEPGGFVPVPSNLTIQEVEIIGVDGTLRSALDTRWMKAAVDRTEVRHRIHVPTGKKFVEQVDEVATTRTGPYDGPWRYADTAADNYLITDLDVGIRVDVQARHFTRISQGQRSFNQYGDWTAIESKTMVGDTVPPGDPSGVSYEPLSGDFRLNFDIPTDRDYAITRVRGVNGIDNSRNPPNTAPLLWAGRGSGIILTIPSSNNTTATGTIWIAHEDYSGQLSNWIRLEVSQLASDDDEEVYVDILWRLGTSPTNPPAAPTGPNDSNFTRVPAAFSGSNQYLWGWARTRPRSLEGDWSPYGAAVAWACGPTVEPSGRFTRQIRYQWRRRGPGGSEGPTNGLPTGNQSNNEFPIVEIRAGYRASLTSAWSAYGVWISIERLNSRGDRTFGTQSEIVTDFPALTSIAGSQWFQGAGVPANSLGRDGDFYLRTSNDDVYEKSDGSWTKVANFRGSDGDTWLTGSTAPSDSAGTDGDWYFRTGSDAAEIYQKVNGSWVKQVDIDSGLDGTVWHSGSGAPANNLGNVGDYYFRTSNGVVYEKTGNTTWTERADITGPQGNKGDKGDKGDRGIPGIDGAVWYSGSGAPDINLGNVGDFYLRTSDGTVWEKTGNSTWTERADITGPMGSGLPPPEASSIHLSPALHINGKTTTSDLTIEVLERVEGAGAYYYEVAVDTTNGRTIKEGAIRTFPTDEDANPSWTPALAVPTADGEIVREWFVAVRSVALDDQNKLVSIGGPSEVVRESGVAEDSGEPPAGRPTPTATPSPGEILVETQASSNVIFYLFRRREGTTGGWSVLGQSEEPFWRDATVQVGRRYQYSAAAKNLNGTSAWSGPSALTTAVGSVSGAPARQNAPTAAIPTESGVLLRIAPVGNIVATGYEWQRRRLPDGDWETAHRGPGVTYTDNPPDGRYEWRVIAYNAAGDSLPSAASTSRSISSGGQAARPGAVASFTGTLTLSANNNITANLRWTDGGGGIPKSWVVEQRYAGRWVPLSGSPFRSRRTGLVTLRFANSPPGDSGGVEHFRVIPENTSGQGPARSLFAEIVNQRAPSPPGALTISNVSEVFQIVGLKARVRFRARFSWGASSTVGASYILQERAEVPDSTLGGDGGTIILYLDIPKGLSGRTLHAGTSFDWDSVHEVQYQDSHQADVLSRQPRDFFARVAAHSANGVSGFQSASARVVPVAGTVPAPEED